MTEKERSILKELDSLLGSAKVRGDIQPVVERVRAQLANSERALMKWEPIPLTIYRDALPAEIRSSWVFVLRAGADTGAERHPNSHQRMMSFQGSGDMQTGAPSKRVSRSKAKQTKSEMVWESNFLVSDPDAPWQRRWISIPPNVWHRPVVGRGGDWVVVAFHTVPAEELIEERPTLRGKEGTKQMRYLGKKLKS
jgi:hypothetical protein